MKNNNGNVLFFILIAVALFAALLFAVAQSNRGNGDVTREQLRLLAVRVVGYGTEISQAINRLILINGCLDTEITFDNGNDPAGRYTNPNSPGDNSCHVFHPDGGGVQWQNFPEFEFDANNGRPLFGTGGVIGAHKVRDFGDDNRHDLYMSILFHSGVPHPMPSDTIQDFCTIVNETAGIAGGSATFYASAALGNFQGDYVDSAGSLISLGRELHPYTHFCTPSGALFTYVIVPLLLR